MDKLHVSLYIILFWHIKRKHINMYIPRVLVKRSVYFELLYTPLNQHRFVYHLWREVCWFGKTFRWRIGKHATCGWEKFVRLLHYILIKKYIVSFTIYTNLSAWIAAVLLQRIFRKLSVFDKVFWCVYFITLFIVSPHIQCIYHSEKLLLKINSCYDVQTKVLVKTIRDWNNIKKIIGKLFYVLFSVYFHLKVKIA